MLTVTGAPDELIDGFESSSESAVVTVMTLTEALRRIKAGTLDKDDVRVVDTRAFPAF